MPYDNNVNIKLPRLLVKAAIFKLNDGEAKV